MHFRIISFHSLLGLVIIASLDLRTAPVAAQSVQAPEVPPTSAPSALANGSPTAAMTFVDGSSLRVRSKAGRFPLVAAAAGESVNIQLRFAPNAVNNGLTAQPLDGGTVSASQSSTSVAADGTASIQFQAGSSPGLYRVLLNQGGTMSILQFWAADLQHPNSGPPALQP